jgi:K+-sensing histidine kinase KdpD
VANAVTQAKVTLRVERMQVLNSRRWAPRGRNRWIIAGAALFTAAVIRTVLHPLLGPIMPGTSFLIAAVLVEYYCGLAPACCVMVAGLCLADYLFVPPYGRIDIIDAADIRLLVSYPLITVVVITLVERLRRAQYRAELLASVAQSRYEMLLRHDNERLLARRATDEMHRMLRHIAQYNRSLILIKALDPSNSVPPASFVATAATATASGIIDDERFNAGIAFGAIHAQVHQEDLARVSDRLLPGHHRMRFMSGGVDWRPVECVCERFTTPSGEFLILRAED